MASPFEEIKNEYNVGAGQQQQKKFVMNEE
jgi:hypothetical protein